MAKERESETRRKRINAKLKSLGWQIIKHQESVSLLALQHHAVEEYPTDNGRADYALFVHGKLLGVIEAKKVAVSPQNVLEQSKRYAQGIQKPSVGNWDGYRVPFLYATNGEKVWFVDVRDTRRISREIAAFHTPDALAEMFGRDAQASYSWLEKMPNSLAILRPYQKDALAAIESAIIRGRREMLVAMATGTGKTVTLVAQIYRLLQSGLAKRVLFLVDRKALAAQAVRTFASFNTPSGNKFTQEYELYHQQFQKGYLEEEKEFDPSVLPNSYLTSPQASHTFVYVATIQRMAINLFGKEALLATEDEDESGEGVPQLDIPIHAFDVVIADECHRGYSARETGVWKNVLDYFDAVKIGLTATPAIHSMNVFKEIVFRYTMEQAILDGVLVDYEVVCIHSDVRIQGMFLRAGETIGKIDRTTGAEVFDQLEDERDFPSAEVEKKITSPDSNRKILEEYARYALEFEKSKGRFPKTLIFAVNDIAHISHADQVVRICREIFARGDDFVQKITASPSVDRPLQRIREFRNRPTPMIVVTVDMLSTGVDIPCLECIVFLRPVKSRILWVQMLGRGTRKCPEIGKVSFTIFDCFGGTLIEYFRDTSDFKVEIPPQETMDLPQLIEKIYQNDDRDYHAKVLVKRLRRIEREMSGKAREQFAAYIPDGDLGKFSDQLADKIRTDFTDTMKLLRDKKFQDLLLHYPKPEKFFFVGYDTKDTVSSEILVNYGQERIKPRDYLDQFSQFIRENQEEIEAVQVLVKRPKNWRTKPLEDLRKTLQQNQFGEPDLRKAAGVVYQKPMADIISMVKHAVHEEVPVYNVEERVDLALKKLTAGKTFTTEQKEWLGLIREHLVANLTIELEDFAKSPIFERLGGITRARKVFAGQLEQIVAEINYYIAA